MKRSQESKAMAKSRFRLGSHKRHQRGITTLAITLMMLVILTVMVLFAANVGFFDQRTTINQNRARLAEQAAEYALNISGEYLKANREKLIDDQAGGWMEFGAGKWVKCSDALPFGSAAHPCMSERNNGAESADSLTKVAGRRATLYFFSTDGSGDAGTLALPYTEATPTTVELETLGVGGTAAFSTATSVQAVMCRRDPLKPVPFCDVTGNNVAVTLIATAVMEDEGAQATVKETWGTYSTAAPQAAVPLVASGAVTGVGNVTIVAAPNAGGYGVVGSIWAASDVDIGNSSGTACGTGGLASVSTCHLGEFLKEGGVARERLKDSSSDPDGIAGCAGGASCDCPAVKNESDTGYADSLSGHLTGKVRKEREDILDMDGGCGSPSITFFPKHGFDDDADGTDDSLFEWIFGVGEFDVVPDDDVSPVNTTCPPDGGGNCAAYRLVEELGAELLEDCSTINAASSGLFYVTGDCALGDAGSKDSPVIVVADGEMSVGGNVFGLVFARSDTGEAQEVKVTGNAKIFGSLVVEGDVAVGGNLQIIYDDTAVGGDPDKIPPSAKFGRLPGSWLDSRSGIGASK